MSLIRDISFSIRLLRKTPVFTAICFLVVAFGVGVSLSLYSINKNFYFGEAPFTNGDRLIVVKRIDPDSNADMGSIMANGFAFNRIRESTESFSELGVSRTILATISDGESAEVYNAAEITPNLLELTNTQPILGRLLAESDAGIGAEPVALIGYHLWQNYYIADPNIVGQQARINGESFTIVGVMPESFSFPITHEIWFPTVVTESASADSQVFYDIIGSLHPNVDRQQASVEMAEITEQLRSEYPGQFSQLHGIVASYTRIGTNNPSGFPLILSALALTILLLVSLNLSTLLFVRANTRHQELTVRNAIGANRWQIAVQVLIESLVICSIGSVCGILLAESITRIYMSSLTVLSDVGSGLLPFWVDFTPNGDALLITCGFTIAIWLLSGGFAAYRASGSKPNQALEGSKGTSSRFSAISMRFVIGTEVTFSVFLLVLCAVFVLAMRDFSNLDYGTSTENVFTGVIDLSSERYDEYETRLQFYSDLSSELSRLSEVSSVTLASALPGQNGARLSYNIRELERSQNQDLPQVDVVWVADNYFESLGVEPLTGRDFDSTDIRERAAVIVIDEKFSDLYWPGESALGKSIQFSHNEVTEWLTVVGVIPQIIQTTAVSTEFPPVVFLPLDSFTPRNLSLAVTMDSDVELSRVSADFKAAAVNIDRDVPVRNIYSLEQVLELNTLPLEVFGNFIIGIALVTLFLSVVGIYGVISRGISLRTNEIGIRRALGSSRVKVISLFVNQGLRFFTFGTVIGGAAVLLIVNAIPGEMSGVLFRHIDVSILTSVTIVGGLVVAASYFPAKKAVSLEPGEALHYE